MDGRCVWFNVELQQYTGESLSAVIININSLLPTNDDDDDLAIRTNKLIEN